MAVFIDASLSTESSAKKPKATEAPPPPGVVKKAAVAPARTFRSPLRDADLQTAALKRARAILAFVETDNRELFLNALKKAFEEMLTKGEGQNGDAEYPHIYLALTYVAKVASSFFIASVPAESAGGDDIWRFLLERLSASGADPKRSSEVAVLACNMLYQAFQHQADWPIEFVQAYLEDAFGPRVWVDDESTRPFVRELLSVTPLDHSSDSAQPEDDNGPSSSRNSPFGSSFISNHSTTSPIPNRFQDESTRDRVAIYASQIVEFHLSTLQSQQVLFPSPTADASESLKNVIRTMQCLLPYPSVRVLAARHVDIWLHHPQTSRHAKELLRRLSANILDPVTDTEAARLILRFKNAPSACSQLFYATLAKVGAQHIHFRQALLRDLLSDLLFSEASAPTGSLPSIGRLFEASLGNPSTGLPVLAEVIKALAVEQSFAPNLKLLVPLLLTSWPTSSPTPLNPTLLCSALCSTGEPINIELFRVAQEDSFEAVANRISLWAQSIAATFAAVLISSMPKVLYDLVPVSGQGIRATADQDNQIRAFTEMSSSLLSSAASWCALVLSNALHLHSKSFLPGILSSFLLLDPISSYYLGSQTLSSDQISSLSSVISSIPIALETSYAIISTSTLLLAVENMFELHEKLVLRALHSPHQSFSLFPQWSNENFVSVVLHHTLVAPSEPQQEAQKSGEPGWAHPALLWKALGLLALVSPFVTAVGEILWSSVPIGRQMMEMMITRSWSSASLGTEVSRRMTLPVTTKVPIGTSSEGAVLEMEFYLFAKSSSVFEPPASLISSLSEWDAELKISSRLLSSRQPDYVSSLLDVQGSAASKWLAHLAFADANLVSLLPPRAIYILLVSSIIGPSSSGYIPNLVSLERTLIRGLAQGCSASLSNSSSTIRAIFSDIISGDAPLRYAAYATLRNLLLNITPGSSASSSQSNLAAPSPRSFTPTSASQSPFALTRANSPFPETVKAEVPRASKWLSSLFKLPFYGSLHGPIEVALMRVLKEEQEVSILEDIVEHLCDTDRPLSTSSADEIDQISLLESISQVIIRVASRGDYRALTQSSLVSQFATLLTSLILPTSPKSSGLSDKSWHQEHRGQVAVVWNQSSLPGDAFICALTVIGRVRSYYQPAAIAALLSALTPNSTILDPAGVTRATILELFNALEPGASDLIAASQWASHFAPGIKAPPPRTRLPRDELWARVGASAVVETNSGMDISTSDSHYAIGTLDSSLPQLSLSLAKESILASNTAVILKRARQECEQILEKTAAQRTLLPQSISDFHQSCVKIASQLQLHPQISDCIELKQELTQWHSKLASVRNATDNAKLAFQLSQELSLLLPFGFLQPDSSLSADILPAFKWDASTLSSADGSTTSKVSTISSQYASETDDSIFLAYWTAKLGESDDCLPFITVAFSRSAASPFGRIAMECIHSEGSWTSKRMALEYLFGPIQNHSAPGSSSQSISSSNLTPETVGLPPVDEIRCDLALDFLTLCAEVANGESTSASSNNTTALLQRLSQPQILRIADLVMLDLVQSGSQPSTSASTADLVSKRARLLVRCCDPEEATSSPSSRQEKAIWLIQHLSQMPGAYSMNTMRWLDDMTLASYGNAKPTTARPELLVSRASQNEGSSSSDGALLSTAGPMTVDAASEALLTQLYFEYPWEVFSVIKHFTNRVSATTVHSKLDYSLHRLLQRLSSESPSVSESALLALRTCAYSHPAFIIKFMPTMSSLLNGKMQQGPDAFYASNGPAILNRVLGVVEMLVPLVLHDSLAKQRLHSMLNEYFRILSALFLGLNGARQATIHLTEDPKRGGNQNRPQTNLGDARLEPLVSRLTYFLASYCNEPLVLHEAVEFFTPHLDTIEAMSAAFPSLSRLQSVIASLKQKRVIEPMKAPLEPEELLRIQNLLKRLGEALRPASASQERKNLKSSMFNSDMLGQVLEALRKIELVTAPYAAHCTVLNFLISDITPLTSLYGPEAAGSERLLDNETFNENLRQRSSETLSPFVLRTIESIRRSALKIALLFLRCFPRSSEGVVSAFVSCLASQHSEVRNDALPHARDVFISCIPGKQQTELMMTLFSLGKHAQTSLSEILAFVADLG